MTIRGIIKSVVSSVTKGVIPGARASGSPDGVMLSANGDFMIFADGDNAAFS